MLAQGVNLPTSGQSIWMVGVLVTVAAAMAGCGPTLQQQYDQAASSAQQTCENDVINNPELAELNALGLFGNRPDIQLMFYEYLPNEQQIAAISYWIQARLSCQQAWQNAEAMRGSQFATNYRLLTSAMGRVDAEFLTGQYTWATYAKTRSQMLDEYERLDSQLTMDAQRDAVAQQQAQAAASAAWAAKMQSLNQAI